MDPFDEVCFERSETENYNLEDLVIPPDRITKHLIEYRVRVLLKGDILIYPGKEIGYISELFTGRIVIKVGNYKSEKIKLSCGTEIAYLILNTFSLI